MDFLEGIRNEEQRYAKMQFDHIMNVWISNQGIEEFILGLLDVHDLFHLVMLLDNDDVINAMKNRSDRYILQIKRDTERHLLAIPSFICHIHIPKTRTYRTGRFSS
jgi:hypothetical protein